MFTHLAVIDSIMALGIVREEVREGVREGVLLRRVSSDPLLFAIVIPRRVCAVLVSVGVRVSERSVCLRMSGCAWPEWVEGG